MFGFSGGEILLIALIALILFGNDKLPENMKKMIKGFNQAKKVAKEVQNSWQDVKIDVQRSINFEVEKQEVQSLINSSSVNLDIECTENDFERKRVLSVPQEEIDEYQTIIPDNELESIHKNSLEENQMLINHYATSKDYIMSHEFMGPKA